MVILQTVLSFLILFGILVFIHELGHFLAARACGMRADVFALGMGPRLFGWNKLNGFTFGKLPEDLDLGPYTDYRICAFPLGGYVKIAGMVDESMDTDFSNRPPQPWEFRSKNTLQKAFAISAGVIMNFLLAIGVFAGLNYFVGKELYDTTRIGPLSTTSPAYEAGLREGDNVRSINGKPIEYFQDIRTLVYVDEAGEDITFNVEREGMPMTITVPRTEIPADPATDGLLLPYPYGIDGVMIDALVANDPAAKAGLKPGDTIVAIEGKTVQTPEQLKSYVTAGKGRDLTVTVNRAGGPVTKTVRPNEKGLIGVQTQPVFRGNIKQVDYGVGEALKSGFDQSVGVAGDIFKLLGNLFAGKAKLKESVGGPFMIAQAAQKSAEQGVLPFLSLMAFLSVTLAVMNILPIPALDGGHLVFILIEGIIRREVPMKVRVAIQQVGVVLLIIFMAFVIYNDTARLIGN